jgi:hypothetical protein
MSKFVWTGPSSYKKRIYRAAVSQRLRNTDLDYAERHLQPRHKYSRSDALAHPSFNSMPKFETFDSVALCGLQISKGNTNHPVCAAHGAP